MTRVAIVGGGLAGLSCGVRCAEAGLDVTILEAGGQTAYPCNSRLAMGFFNVAFRDIEESADSLFEGVMLATDGTADNELAGALAGAAGPALEWLKGQGVRIRRGTWRRGTHNMLYPPAAIGPGLRWPGRGADQMLRCLEDRLVSLGGRLLRGRTATSLDMRAGAVAGVAADNAGVEHLYQADAVVLADGGFQADADLVREHVSPRPDLLVARNAGTGRGAALRMALDAGADCAGMREFYGHLQSRDALTNPMLWPYPVLDHLAAAGIVVDAEGRRICDEGRGGVAMANDIARRADPLPAFAIFDHAIWMARGTEFPLPANPLLIKHGATLHVGANLGGLAAATGFPAAALIQTIGAYNEAVAEGRTEELQPPRTTGAIKAWPIARPPFYAAPVAPGLTYTMGGIRIDAAARVLTAEGGRIAGLFAAGSATGGLEGGPRAGYTGGLSKALVTGWLAGAEIARGAA